MASDLNLALVLKLVDEVTAPARSVMGTLRGIGDATEATGRAGVAWANEQLAANEARRGALMGEALGVAALAGSIAAALKPAIDFEQSMAGVAAVARADDEELARLTDTARHLGATTAWAASDAADGMKFLSMAGFEVEETVAAMPGMLNLASAGAIDLARASDIASNVLSGFGMQAAETGRLGDVLTNTFTTSNTDLAMLGETMKYVAPNAAALGVSLEQTAAMAGKLGDAGIQGSQAGTALRAMLQRLAALPTPAADAMEKLGVRTADASGTLRDLPTVLAEIHSAMEEYGSADRARTISEIFGVEASAAATILLEQAGSGALQAYTESLKETGSAARVAARLNDTTAGSLKRLQSIAESVAISVGTVLIPEVAKLLESVLPLIGALDAWAQANPELISMAFRLTAAFLALRLGSIALRWGLFTMLIPILKIIRAASWMLVLLPRMAGALLALLNPLKLVRAALIAIRLAFIATGVGAVLVGIAMAGIWIYNNWQGLKAFFVGFWSSFRAALGPAAPLLDAIVDRARRIRDWFASLLAPMDASEEQWLSWGLAAGEALGAVVERVAGWMEANKGLVGTLTRLWLGFTVLRLGLLALRAAWLALSLLAPLKWARLIPKLVWGASHIPKIGWVALAGKLAWDVLVTALTWTATLIPKIAWLALAGGGKVFKLIGLVEAVTWTAKLIPKIAWLDLANGGERYGLKALVTALKWTTRLIPVIGWAVLAGELAWHLIVKPLGWDDYLPKIDWVGVIGAFSWEGWIPKIDWDRIVGSISWPKPPKWLRWLMGEVEPEVPLIEDTPGFDLLGPDTREAARTIEAARSDGPLPSDTYLEDLRARARTLREIVAEFQAELDNATQAETKAGFQEDMAPYITELKAVEAELAEAEARAKTLSDALALLSHTETAPQIDTESIDAALIKVAELAAGLSDLPGAAVAPTPHIAGSRDLGGPVRAGMPYLVGERGRELFVPGVAGTILPTRVLSAAAAATAMAAPVAAMPERNDMLAMLDRRPALSAPAVAPAPRIERQGDTIVINIYPPRGMSAEEVGRELERRLARREDERRRDLHDGVDY